MKRQVCIDSAHFDCLLGLRERIVRDCRCLLSTEKGAASRMTKIERPEMNCRGARKKALP
jgi:hypothetical protein